MSVTGRRRLLADLALAGSACIWGSTFVVVKRALDDSSTLLFLALRFTLASGVLALLFRRSLASHPNKKSVLAGGALVGAALFLGYLFQTLGLRLTTPTKSAFITSVSVVLVPVCGALVFRVRPGWNSWAGVGLATPGLYLLLAPRGPWETSRGDLLTLVCAAAFAVHVVLVGRFSPTVGAAALTTAQVAVAAALSLASFSWAEQPYVRWTAPFTAALLISGLLSTALGFWAQNWAQQFTSPTHTALMLTLEPVFASLTSYLALGEVLGPRGLAGAGLILGGIVLSEVKAAAPRAAGGAQAGALPSG